MSAITAALPHRKFTVDEYHFFIEQEVFKPEERIELWEGEFIEMSANGIREAWLIDLENNRVEIHSEPSEMGYSPIRLLHRGQGAESTVLPQIKISVEEILK